MVTASYRFALFHASSLLLVFGAAVAGAATFTWDGGGADANWQSKTNWSTDVAPASDGTATLSFSGVTRPAAVNNYPADTAFSSLNFLNDNTVNKTAPFTLSGARITLGGTVTTTTPASGTLTDTISLNMVLSNNVAFAVNRLSATVYHNLTVSGVISDSGGSWGLTKTSTAGTLALTGANTYRGKTTVSGGTLTFNTIGNVGAASSALGAPTTVADGTIDLDAALTYTGASASSDRVINVTGNNMLLYNNGTGDLTLTGGITGNNRKMFIRGTTNIIETGVIATGTSDLWRTDPGKFTMTNPNNSYSGLVMVAAGTVSVNSISDGGTPSALGQGALIQLGQASAGFGTLQFTGTNGGSCNRTISILGTTSASTSGGIIENTVAGQTLLLSGNVSQGGTGTSQGLQLIGAGNGEMSGVISTALSVSKSGAGTWTLSGTNTYTGSTAVNAGTLLINGSTAAASAVTVAAAGTLGGTGTVNGAVSVTAGGKLAPGSGGIGTLALANGTASALTLNGNTINCELSTVADISDRIAVAGTLVLNGANTITLATPLGTPPAGTYRLMTYAARSGDGTLALDRVYPNAVFTLGETNVTLTVTGSGTSLFVSWQGDGTANAWNLATPNWLSGSSPISYVDGEDVLFDDAGFATPEIAIGPDPVAPLSITVNSTKAYTFGGAPISGTCGLTKLGASALTLSGSNTYSGTTTVGVNGTANSKIIVNHSAALGSAAGGTTVYGGNGTTENQLYLGNGVTVKDETLTLATGASYRAGLLFTPGTGTATWDGNIVLSGGGGAYLWGDSSTGVLVIGGSADDTITGTTGQLSLRGNGIMNSRINIGTVALGKDTPATWTLNTASNKWGSSSVYQGILKLGIADALPVTTTLKVGKDSAVSEAIFDLNGKNQTVAGLGELHYSGAGTQKIVSSTPATLTVSNATPNSFGTTNSSIEGLVSVVKMGAGTLTLTGTNTTFGGFAVNAGTLTVSATGTLGDNSTNITVTAGTLTLQNSFCVADAAAVRIADGGGAKLNLAAGVNETVRSLFFGDKQKRAGTYSAEAGSGVDFVDTVHFTGSGILTVRRGNGGFIMRIY